jgi:hypothetical protein
VLPVLSSPLMRLGVRVQVPPAFKLTMLFMSFIGRL